MTPGNIGDLIFFSSLVMLLLGWWLFNYLQNRSSDQARIAEANARKAEAELKLANRHDE